MEIDSFYGPMANFQRFIHGEDTNLISSPDDAIYTMKLVNAAIESHQRGRNIKFNKEYVE